jgi:putative membrane protein
VVTGGAAGNLPSLATVVVTFVAGAVVGLVSVAHLIRWALDAYRTATLVFLVSLMVGSLRLPVVEVTTNVDAWTPAAAGLITLAVVVGAGAVLLLDYYTADLSGMAN